MSAISQVLTACPDLQFRLRDRWTTGEMTGADERMPFLNFMLSPENRQGITTDILPGQGKTRLVQLKYMQRLTEDLVLTNQVVPNCGPGEDPGDLSTTYTMDVSQNFQSPGFNLNAAMLEDVCTDNSTLFYELLEREWSVLRRRVATELAEQAVALAGGWSIQPNGYLPTGTDPGEVNPSDELVIRTIASGVISTTAWNDVYNAAVDSGFGTDVAIFPGTVIRKYYQTSLAGCCNNDGLDLRALFDLYGFGVAYDARVELALGAGTRSDGAGDALVVRPGALQLLQYTQSPWKENLPIPDSASNYYQAALQDPASGLIADMVMEFDCGQLSVKLTETPKIIGLPNDMYATGDPYEGITGVARVTTSNT